MTYEVVSKLLKEVSKLLEYVDALNKSEKPLTDIEVRTIRYVRSLLFEINTKLGDLVGKQSNNNN